MIRPGSNKINFLWFPKWILMLSQLVMHNVCFFLRNVYSPSLNGTERVWHVLSHCPFMGSSLHLYSDSRLGLPYLVVTSDMFFFHFWNEKQRPKGHLKYGGVPSVWGGEGDSEEKLFFWGLVRKYVANACFWGLLVWSGMIWGRFRVILVILECRITVC